MAFRSFHFTLPDGSPATGLSLSAVITERDGTPVATTALDELGGGAYGIEVTGPQEAAGVVLFVDGGLTVEPSARYQVQTCATDGLFAVLFMTAAGVPYAGAGSPAWSVYRDPDGTDISISAPSWAAIGNGIYTATIPALHLAVGIAAKVTPPGTAVLPAFYTATLVPEGGGGGGDTDPPIVSVSPPAGTPIAQNQPLIITVQDNVALRRVLMVARFPSGEEELIFTGTRFSTRYASSSQTPQLGGVIVTARRTNGWPDAPTIDVYALDTSGNEG